MPNPRPPISFKADIAPLFSNTDIAHMQGMDLDLSKYEIVKARADDILSRLKDKTKPMPPKESGGPWPAEKIALFQRWVNEGKPA